jgi:hypothetical protein
MLILSCVQDGLKQIREEQTTIVSEPGQTGNGFDAEPPRKFGLVINLKTAKEIGVPILEWVVYRADGMIK